MNTSHKPLILIVDDEEAILKTLKDALTDESYRVETLSDGNKALDAIGKLIPDLLLLDIFMPNCNGLALLEKIKQEYPDQKVIIISGFGTVPIAIEAVKKGALDFIEKPLNLDEILQKISFLQNEDNKEKNAVHETNVTLRKENAIIGESNLFLELMQQVERLAPYQFPILIYGEHGTGKSTLASYIHKISARQELFSAIDGETVTHDMLEKVFSCPKPSTIYIKHIDQLDKILQKSLLLFIETNKTHRIIASSKTSLFAKIQNNTFNESLFYTLNMAPIEVPPLRKRPYDIPLLLNYYLEQYNAQHKKKIIFNTQTIRQLRNHQWPGNILELRQVIQNVVAQTSETYFVAAPDDLVPILGEKNMQFIEEQSLARFDSLEQATNTFTKNFLQYLLKKNHFNIDQVSNRLNVSPAQLKNKLLELKIDF